MMVDLVVPAGGVGRRFDSKMKKQFFEIEGRPIIYYTLRNILRVYDFTNLIIGCNLREDAPILKNILSDLSYKNYMLVDGGEERCNTVFNCITYSKSNYVIIHDAVRPFVSRETVVKLIEKLSEFDGAICGVFARDTVKRVKDFIVCETLKREELFLSHTPQAFRRDELLKVCKDLLTRGVSYTDESQAMEIGGKKVAVVPSNFFNVKITYKEDIEIVRELLKKWRI